MKNSDEHIDPRVKRTRLLLEEAMRELMREKRFNSISVLDIAERATVNRATFYAHYPDKQAIMVAVLKSDLRKFLCSRLPAEGEMNAQFAVALTVGLCDFLADVNGKCPAAAKEFEHLLVSSLQSEIFDLVRHALKNKTASETHAVLISWSVFGIAQNWVQGNRKRDKEEVALELASHLFPK